MATKKKISISKSSNSNTIPKKNKTIRRPSYFSGKILTSADLEKEQEYFKKPRKARTNKEKTINKNRSNFVPKVNDEVLVKFEQGDIKKPIVIGSKWNKTDKPPETSSSKKATKKIVKKFKAAKMRTGSIKKSNSKTKTKKT